MFLLYTQRNNNIRVFALELKCSVNSVKVRYLRQNNNKT